MSKDNKLDALKSTTQYWLRKVDPVVNKNGALCPNSLLLSKEIPAVFGRGFDGVNVRLLSRKLPLMISRKHATVEFVDGLWKITDHGSVNGVFVNGAKIPSNSQHPIKTGDRIVFGCPTNNTPNSEFEYVFHEVVKEKSCKRTRSEESGLQNSKKRCFQEIPDKASGSSSTAKENDSCAKQRLFDDQIPLQEGRVKHVKCQLNKKEKAHEQRTETLEKRGQASTEELQKQEEERKLERLLEEQLREKELHLKNQFDEQIKNLIAEQKEVEKNLQEELKKKVTEKDNICRKQLQAHSVELLQIITEMQIERANREEEMARNQELRNNLRNKEEKERMLGQSLDELKKQIKDKDSRLQRQQDISKNAEEAGKRSVLHQMEDEFTCMICHELFVEAVTLSCAHSFCEMCLRSWIHRKKDCPVCRKKINGKAVKSLVLNNAIDKMLENADNEKKQTRLALINERIALKQAEQGRGFEILLATDGEQREEEERRMRLQNAMARERPGEFSPGLDARNQADNNRRNPHHRDDYLYVRLDDSIPERDEGRRWNHDGNGHHQMQDAGNTSFHAATGSANNNHRDQHQRAVFIERAEHWNNEGNRRNYNGMGNRVCYNCGERGHFARNCYHRWL